MPGFEDDSGWIFDVQDLSPFQSFAKEEGTNAKTRQSSGIGQKQQKNGFPIFNKGRMDICLLKAGKLFLANQNFGLLYMPPRRHDMQKAKMVNEKVKSFNQFER